MANTERQVVIGDSQTFIQLVEQSLHPDPSWTSLFPVHFTPMNSMASLSVHEKTAIIKDLQGAQAPSSRATIASKFRKFWHYTSTLGESPLPISEGRILTYIQFLREDGRVSPLSAPQYVSAILSISRWFGNITTQPLLASDLLRSWKIAVVDDITVNQARPIPAQLFLAITPFLESLEANTKILRAVLALWTAFMFFSRGDSIYAAKKTDISIKDNRLEFVERRHKRKRVERAKNFIRSVPCDGFRAWLHALEKFTILRTAAWSQDQHVPDSFWQLPGERPPGRSFLSACLHHVENTIPTHFGRQVFTSHSCRRGAASAALSIGVPLERISWWGGWSFNSASIFEYLDFSMQSSPAANLFFGWLKTSPAGDVPAEALSEDEPDSTCALLDKD